MASLSACASFVNEAGHGRIDITTKLFRQAPIKKSIVRKLLDNSAKKGQNRGMAQITRRQFVAGATATTAALSAPSILARGFKMDQIKVGVIGCGGRGTGAAFNAVEADDGVVIWAMADVFADHMESSKKTLKEGVKDKFQVTQDRTFIGFDAYKQLLALKEIDYVILATPPGFRPIHFAAAIEKGKHVFFEKPVATDAPGVRKVVAASQIAKQKGLSVVTGTQRRHDRAYMECMNRIHDGQMGDIVACYAYWNQGSLWMHPRQDAWGDLEWQLRNWLYFAWLSGDHICEQHIHNLDVCNWAKNGHPVKCTSLAGRQVRTEPAYGHIFDHFATEYEYADGSKMLSMCRQIDGCASRVSEDIVGTKGRSNANTFIKGENAWRWDGQREDPYMLEHKDLIKSIRNGEAVNEGIRVAESTLTAIMGRMSAYTGKEISWDQAMNSLESLVPEHCDFDMKLSVPEIAVPGKTVFA